MLRRSLLTAGAGGLVLATASPALALSKPEALSPDGSSDQTAAFARALAAAAAARKPLTLEAGTYRISGVELPDGSVITGTPGATRLLASAPGPVLKAASAARVTLSGLVVDGGGGATGEGLGLVSLEGVAEVTLHDCAIVSTSGTCLVMEGCGGRIDACRFERADRALLASNSAGLSIHRNTVRGCANNGIVVQRSAKGYDGTIISGNRIEAIRADGGGLGWYGNGINVFRAGNVVVSGNVIRDCGFTFIRANSADAVQIVANNCEGAGETGIYSEFSFEGAVVASNMVRRAATGISVVNYDKGGRLASVVGNVVRDAFVRPLPEGGGQGYGAGIAVEATTAASGNTVEGCPRGGFVLGYGNYLADVNLTGNVARDCRAGVVVTVAKSEGNALISGNVFSRCAEGGVVGYEWEKKATGDLAAPGAAVFPGITVQGNVLGA
jgi:uncharacterized secreted repeat protein (TIGR03808 family)